MSMAKERNTNYNKQVLSSSTLWAPAVASLILVTHKSSANLLIILSHAAATR